MSFTSYAFFVFFAAFFCLYWATTSLKWQNVLVCASSLLFYGWWDWRFIFLLLGITIANYIAAIVIEASSNPSYRRTALVVAVSISFAALAVFKYFNFFV